MSQHPLNAIEWHDLPVHQFSITERGIKVLVMPFNEDSQGHDLAALSLRDAETLRFDFQGEFASKDLDGLEITSFTFSESEGASISGEIIFLLGLPSRSWILEFTGATWALDWP